MNRCLISYEPVPDGQDYSVHGLRVLHSRLAHLDPLPFTETDLIHEAANRAGKMSIQGIQPKLSAVLRVAESRLEIVNVNGRFILKPPNPSYPQLPENEDLTMKLGKLAGLETPDHGLVRARDGKLVYWIRRFDRIAQKGKLPVEDFAQLSGRDRETKYDSSVEQVVSVIEQYCTFPMVEKRIFFQRFLFNFLIGNEDMHLKNYSLITKSRIVRLAPCYDLLNSTIVLKEAREESALPLGGKKSGFTRNLFIKYLGTELLGLTPRVVDGVLRTFKQTVSVWSEWIDQSFIAPEFKTKYQELVRARYQRVFESV